MNKTGTVFQKPWLSVVIPIYNAEKFLGKCLDSILEQTYKNFEVLLIDDGSTDTSSEICKNYSRKDSRFHYIRKENGGAYQSRIYGAEQTRGTYIMFCDADDYYVSKKAFACLHEVLSGTYYSVVQFAYLKKYNHLSKKCSSVKTPIIVDKTSFSTQEYPKLLCSFWEGAQLTTSVCNKIYHRNLLSNLPNSNCAEKVFWGEDLILNLHLLSTCESIYFIPNALYCYRQASGGTSNFSVHTMRDVDNVKKYQLLHLERYQGNSKEKIEKVLYSEVAGWFFLYVQQALDHLTEKELVTLITESLRYPRFVLARDYYMNKSTETWDAVSLLRKANAFEYIDKAKEYRRRRKIKDSIHKFFKRVYTSI